ncbi:hypothetical protein [Arcticibacter eurypsychrophilus]|uniref:hypothetical protein n=1 Tax=Arcticibacter eurypsychrophilus TaxID=1434752 RepID=UPI001112DEED|nr:hypothetical protein [Arcticibacter eurypsychrophilus]
MYTILNNIITAFGPNGGSVFFLAGSYSFSNFLNITGISNFKIVSSTGAKLTTGLNKIFLFSGTFSNLEIAGLRFESIRSNTTDDPDGMITFANFGTSDIENNIYIHDCYFTNPNTKANAIKMVSEGAASMISNIRILYNQFISIGRMGIEIQNHNYSPVKVRIQNFKIDNNYLYDVGTIQTGVSVSCISVSGTITDGQINYNSIRDMRMNTTTNTYYGIENAGAIRLNTIGNLISSSTYGFTGILASGTDSSQVSAGIPIKRSWIVANNIIELAGSITDKTKIREIDINNIVGYSIHDNIIVTDGVAMRLTNASYGIIHQNRCKVLAGNVLYLQGGSTYNKINFNLLDNSGAGSQDGMISFNDSNTVGNRAIGNSWVPQASGNFYFTNNSGAVNNTNSISGYFKAITINDYNISEGDDILFVNISSGGQIHFPNPIAYIGNAGREISIYNENTLNALTLLDNLKPSTPSSIPANGSAKARSNGSAWIIRL